MRKLIILAPVCLLIGGCVVGGSKNISATVAAARAAAATNSATAKVANTVDAKVASASARLASYCPLIQGVLNAAGIGSSIFSTGNVPKAVSAAKVVASDFCSSVPTDIVSGATLVQAAVSDLQSQGMLGGAKVAVAPMALYNYHKYVSEKMAYK